MSTQVDRLRAEAVVALGLAKRKAYMDESEAAVNADVQQAAAGAKSDPELQALLKEPRVKAAMERIAADPGAIADYQDDAMVTEAMQRLQGYLTG